MFTDLSIKFHKTFNHSFNNPGVVASLYSNRLIQRISSTLIGLFFPVYLFQTYGSIQYVLLFYFFIYLIHLLLIAPATSLASVISFRNSLVISVMGGCTFYLSLLFFDVNVVAFSILAIAALVFDMLFYWIPFHSGVGKFLDHSSRGSAIGKFGALDSVIGVFIPLIAGFIVARLGFSFLFIAAFIVYAVSVVPLSVMPRINEYFSFSYLQTWKILFDKRDWKILITYMADGSQTMIGTLIWPIFIWQVLDGDFEAVGVVAAMIVAFTIILKLFMGNYSDKFDKKKLVRYGTVLYSFGWLARAFVQTGVGIFITSSYHNFSSIIMRTPYDALMYEKASDSGHYIDEYAVLRAMSLSLGRVLTLILLMVLFHFAGLQYAFIFAAIVSLFINFI